MAWTTPAQTWERPLAEDELAAKVAELGLTPKTNVVAFEDFRFTVAQGGDGALSILLVTKDGQFSRFPGVPA